MGVRNGRDYYKLHGHSCCPDWSSDLAQLLREPAFERARPRQENLVSLQCCIQVIECMRRVPGKHALLVGQSKPDLSAGDARRLSLVA
jgi:hypothetical protein